MENATSAEANWRHSQSHILGAIHWNREMNSSLSMRMRTQTRTTTCVCMQVLMWKFTFSTTSATGVLCVLLEMNEHTCTRKHTRTHAHIQTTIHIPHRWQLLSFSIPFDDLIYAKLYTSDVVEFDLNSSTIISHSENVHSLRSSIRNALATDSSFHTIIFLFPLKLLSPPC